MNLDFCESAGCWVPLLIMLLVCWAINAAMGVGIYLLLRWAGVF